MSINRALAKEMTAHLDNGMLALKQAKMYC